MVDILAQEKPRVIKLADGNDYTLPPIDLTTLANVEKTMGFGLGRLAVRVETETMTTIRLLIYALLKESYPDLTAEKVGHLITLSEIPQLSETLSTLMAISS